MKKAIEQPDQSSAIAPAFYEGKEEWKAKPGNRYGAEDLHEMARKWKVRFTRPVVSTVRKA
jgi:hypothetical protein